MSVNQESIRQISSFLSTLPLDRRMSILTRLSPYLPDRRSQDRHLVYLDNPEKYSREILKSDPWSGRQRAAGDDVLQAINDSRPLRLLNKGGHGTGKSHITDDLIAWLWSVPGNRDADEGGPQGCALIMTAPTRENFKKNTYAGLIRRGRIAHASGLSMPGWLPRKEENYGGASSASILWHEGPWRMEGISPKASASKDVAHSAGGTHHHYLQIIVLEEAMGVPPEMVAAVEGLSVARNVIILATTNPTSTLGFLYGHIKKNRKLWVQHKFSQLDHPNVTYRREVYKGAVDHLHLESKIRALFEDRGPSATTSINPDYLDFEYALPPEDMEDKPGPRIDGIPGHPDAIPHVFRPTSAQVAGQHLGDWLESDAMSTLFHCAGIENRLIRENCALPDFSPDQVGVDCAQGRHPVACPRWGPSAWKATRAGATGGLTLGRPIDVSWVGAHPNAKARSAADDLISRYGLSTLYVLDRAFGGEVGSALEAKGARIVYVQFGSTDLTHEPHDLYGPVLNVRTEMAVDCARVFNSGIARMPYVDRVIHEMRATGALELSKQRGGAKVVREKKEIEKALGHSPDSLDSVWLALAEANASFIGIS